METLDGRLQRDLIFDLGMHKAEDAAFYLAKGFRVVAVEANPAFIPAVVSQQAEAIAQGRLTVVERALWHKADEFVSFFISRDKDDWSSIERGWAEKGGATATEICVLSTTFDDLLDHYGLPYYVKCDIEGADALFTSQLAMGSRRPAFVSVEAHSLDVIANLYSAGFRLFQLVNQAMHWRSVPPLPAREGQYSPTRFSLTMSGLFGRELPPEKWMTFSEVAERYFAFTNAKVFDDDLAHGWLDCHATTEAWLK